MSGEMTFSDLPPLSVEKYNSIYAWVMAVEEHRASWSPSPPPSPSHSAHSSFSSSGFNESAFYTVDDGIDMEQKSFVFDGDQRLLRMPHPVRNPLVSCLFLAITPDPLLCTHITPPQPNVAFTLHGFPPPIPCL